MAKKGSSSLSRDVVLDNPVDIVLDFNKISSFRTMSQEIRKSLLTGNHTADHKIHPANIVLSALRDFNSDAGSFEYVDFKDSFIERSAFQESSFDYAAIINCQFENVEFSRCHFHNVSITGSIFQNTTFRDCALDHMVIESCKFISCSFVNCTTSNKLFEYCLIYDCTFTATDLQVQTIISNFGISEDNLIGSNIRDRSVNERFAIIDRSSLASYLPATPIEAFKIAYFLDKNIILYGSDDFDATFQLESWIGTAKIPLTFTNLMSTYADFLIYLYDDQKLLTFPILKLHSLSAVLVERPGVPSSVLTTVYGMHMILSRLVEEYLAVVTSYVRSLGNSASILVNGPLDRHYYIRNYPYLFAHPDLSIEDIRKHNSPNEILLSWDTAASIAPLIAAFMASRFKFEIAPYRDALVETVDALEGGNRKNRTPGRDLLPPQSLFELRVGFDQDDKYLYGIKLKSVFPGKLLLELGIHLSVRKIAVVRDVIIGILTSGGSKAR